MPQNEQCDMGKNAMLQKLSLGIILASLMSALAFAQQPVPSCEDQLAQAQTQLTLVQTTRAQGEYIASDALAASRKTVTHLQARIANLEKQLAAIQTPASAPTASSMPATITP